MHGSPFVRILVDQLRHVATAKEGMMAARFVIKTSKDGQFMFVLKAGNNEIILTSELYTQKHGAENGIESVRRNAVDDARFERKTAKSGEPYFVLKAANGEVIGASEMYSSTSAMERGIASVKKNSQFTPVEDQTVTKTTASP
jgi:uncharacterized protein YegP (UPF0339 family)